LVLGPSWYDEI
jgi:hypothetical protein